MKKKVVTVPDPEADAMQFERTLMLFFGDTAYQTAGQAATPSSRRHWIRRVLTLVIRAVDKIETTVRHKQLLMKHAADAHKSVGTNDQPSWKFVYHLINLIGRLIGLDYHRGTRLHTLSYWQTHSQFYAGNIQSGGEGMQDYYDGLDAVTIRQRVVQFLKKEGLSDFKIALVLHTTEHEIQQLRLGTHKKLKAGK